MPSESKSATEEQVAPSSLLQQIRETNLSRQPRVTFPLPRYPNNPYWHGPRSGDRTLDQTRFGWPRDGGARRHAAVDLEAPIGTLVLAMADGIVLRTHDFYSGTSEIAVLHPGIGIIRYGEVDSKSRSRLRDVKAFVRQGEPIAVVGQRVDNGKLNPRAMLHLEFFTDESRNTHLKAGEANSLTKGPKGAPEHPSFERRNDMEDPTKLVESAPLQNWNTEIFSHDWVSSHCFLTDAPMSRVDETKLRILLLQALLPKGL